jgi:A/G-specific adenine glycosylase
MKNKKPKIPILENNLIIKIRERKLPIQKHLLEWGRTNYRQFPWRNNRTPYSVLIAEVLLKRTTAAAVNVTFENFIVRYPSVEKLSKADCLALEKFLSKLGYHKIRARILIEISNYILNNYGGQIPKDIDGLLKIPHVGLYTANSILCFANDLPAAILDTNVDRIIKRVFQDGISLTTSLGPSQYIAQMLLPEKNAVGFNYAMLDLGALVCKSGIPLCPACPINKYCDYFISGKPFRD